MKYIKKLTLSSEYIFGASLVIPVNFFANLDLWHLLLPIFLTKTRLNLTNILYISLLFIVLITQILLIQNFVAVHYLSLISLMFIPLVLKSFSIPQVMRLYSGLISGGLIITIVSLLEIVFQNQKAHIELENLSSFRLSSLYAEPNELSIYLLFLSAIIVTRDRILRRKILGTQIILTLFFVQQLFTFSRFSILLNTAIIITQFLKLGLTANIKKILAVCVLLFCAVLAAVLSGVSARFFRLIETGANDETLSIRINSIRSALEGFFRDGNIFVGLGPKNIGLFLPEGVNTTSNLFIDVLVEHGIFGLLLLLIFLFKNCFRYPNIGRSGTLTLLVVLLNGMTYSVLYLPIFWVALAISWRGHEIDRLGPRLKS